MPPQNPTAQNVSQPSPPQAQVFVPPPKKGFSKFFSSKIFIFSAGIFVFLIVVSLIFSFFRKNIGGGGGEIVWWGLWEDEVTVAPLISEYEASHPNVKIRYIKQSPQDYRERLVNALAKGQGPDIFRFHNTWVPMLRGDLDSVPQSVMTQADFAKNFYPVAVGDLTSPGGLAGIPLEYDGLALFINEDIFNKAGKTPPATWDDLRTVARELTVKNDQGAITQSGVSLGRTENVDNWQEILALLMIQNGVDLANPTGKNAEDALTFFTIFSTTDGVWDATLPSSTQAFAAGKLAMYIAPSWRAFEIQTANPSLKFKTVPVPQLPKDNPNTPDTTYATYWVEGVWSKSSKKTLAWDFLKFLSTQSSLTKLYANESNFRSFGEPYPRVDMASLISNHPILGSIVSQATGARSWYLASRTFDGPTGINSQLSNYFGDAVNAVADGKETPQKALETAAQGVAQVLSQYRILAK